MSKDNGDSPEWQNTMATQRALVKEKQLQLANLESDLEELNSLQKKIQDVIARGKTAIKQGVLR